MIKKSLYKIKDWSSNKYKALELFIQKMKGQNDFSNLLLEVSTGQIHCNNWSANLNKYLERRNLEEQGLKENERSFYEPLAVFVSHVKHTYFFLFFKKDLSTESIYAFCCAIICKKFHFRLEFQVTHSNLIRNWCYPNTYDTLHTT